MSKQQDVFECNYLDANSQNAGDMLLKCVQKNNGIYDFNCQNNPYDQENMKLLKDTARINNIPIKRDYITYSIDQVKSGLFGEGFTNYVPVDKGPGKSNDSGAICPDGFTRCPVTGKCIQKCRGCNYRDYMKSQQMNTGDPCFPNGVYNGIDNMGFTKCTCGQNNQYCSDTNIKNIFTAEGMMKYGDKIVSNVGITYDIDVLYSLDQ